MVPASVAAVEAVRCRASDFGWDYWRDRQDLLGEGGETLAP